ncbi:mitochondrial import receptor protein [Scheffersomyces spartinae]|uniref:Mitochondrial import receptor protein n=1 Tax=Scheffersomyces spartinae TaxID=45513 RepID=A0A9P8AGI9_9ASCO|nr:mitochondrial import receptor protein [Scheffersomyces spartinae]KAG7191784.1 mitochondrial import receptor protein [Scheffersomyces spartinae]
MVKIVTVEEGIEGAVEVPVVEKVGVEGEGETFSDSESESESDFEDDFDIENESIYDRIVALKDIIPPQHRSTIVSTTESVYGMIGSTLRNSGNALWVVSSSLLLLGVPLSLAILSETQLQEMEREMKLQQAAQDLSAIDGAKA